MNSSPKKFLLKKSTEIRDVSKFTTEEMSDVMKVKCEVKIIEESNKELEDLSYSTKTENKKL